MSDRPERASHQLHGLTTAALPRQHAPMSWPQRETRSTDSAGPHLPRGPLYPNIPRQWTGPDGESIPLHWSGPPPAGLDASIPVPRTHPIRNTVLGLTALLAMFVVLGGLASSIGLALSTGPSATIGAWQDNGGLDRVKAVLNDLEAAQDAGKADDLAGMSRACRSLHSDAEAAKAYMPIPDPPAQTHWAAALAHLTHASATCVNAIRNRDADLFAQASAEMGAVPADVSEVLNRLLTLNQ
jgi:hypothetical protein